MRQVSGSRGSGKTSYIKAKLIAENIRRRIIFDPIGPSHVVDEHEDYPEGVVVELQARTRKELSQYLGDVRPGDPFSVSLVPSTDEAGDLDWIVSNVIGEGRLSDVTLVVEEAHASASHRTCPPSLRKLAKRGRHWGVDLWLSSQRPSDVDANLRAELNSHESVYFKLIEQIDLDILTKRRDKEFAAMVRALPDLGYYVLDPAVDYPQPGHIVFNRFGSPECAVGL